MNFVNLIFENVFIFLKIEKNSTITNKLSYIKHHEQIILQEKKSRTDNNANDK